MANVSSHNEKCTIENVNVAARDVIQHHHHYPETSATRTNASVEFHLNEVIQSFKGREHEIELLTNMFFTQNHKMVVVSGCPGYGKTELCNKFVHYCKDNDRVSNILWMDAETPDKLLQSFKDLSKVLHLPEVDNQTLVNNIYKHFNRNSADCSTIVVFDNALNRQQILSVEPKGKCLCLVTSHESDWGVDVPALRLEPLSPDAALAVLRVQLGEHFRTEDAPLYRELAELLSHVPLALQVAAAYVRQEMLALRGRFHLCKYVQELRISPENLMVKPMPNSTKNSYKLSIYQALTQSLRKMENIKSNHSELALIILNLCSYFDTGNIVSSTFLKFDCIQKLFSDSKKRYLDDVTRALSLLQNYSLIRLVDNERITIHRLVQEILISHQNVLFKNDINQYYFNCLEFLLSNSDNTHKHFICKRAEQQMHTFQKFYTIYKTKIMSTPSFLENIVDTGCEIFLNIVLDELGVGAADVADARCLLHAAVRCAQPGVLEMLLQRGAHVNQCDHRGDTPLHLAADNLDLRIMEILVSRNADVTATDKVVDAVLHRVIAAPGYPQHVRRSEEACAIVRWLVRCGARTDVVGLRGWTLLHEATQALSADLVRCLINEYGLNVNIRNQTGQTPLYYVSVGASTDRFWRLRTAECLLELGARRDVVDSWGRTPAQHACERGLMYLEKYLDDPSRGFDSTQTSEEAHDLSALTATGQIQELESIFEKMGEHVQKMINEFCLLHVAAGHGRVDVLQLLLDHGADINNRDDKNDTALFRAIQELHLDAVQLLVSRGADPNPVDGFSWSILHELVSQGSWHVGRQGEVCAALRSLVKSGARTDVVTPGNMTLLHVAARDLQPDLMRCLVREFKQDVHAVKKNGQTPLYDVCTGLWQWGADEVHGLSVAACLVDLGARSDVVDKLGNTPAEYARQSGYERLARYLEEADGEQRTDVETGIQNKDKANRDASTVLEISSAVGSDQWSDTNTQTESQDRAAGGSGGAARMSLWRRLCWWLRR